MLVSPIDHVDDLRVYFFGAAADPIRDIELLELGELPFQFANASARFETGQKCEKQGDKKPAPKTAKMAQLILLTHPPS
jgi:hypothetical protein